MSLEHTNWLARLHQQRLVVLQIGKRAHDGVEALPVTSSLSVASVND